MVYHSAEYHTTLLDTIQKLEPRQTYSPSLSLNNPELQKKSSSNNCPCQSSVASVMGHVLLGTFWTEEAWPRNFKGYLHGMIPGHALLTYSKHSVGDRALLLSSSSAIADARLLLES
jgi:hypothetical protein